MVITLRAQIELRFALRRTVSEIEAVEIQVSDNGGFSPIIAQGAQNSFLPNDNHSSGPNRAPFRSTTNGFRDIRIRDNGKTSYGS